MLAYLVVGRVRSLAVRKSSFAFQAVT